MNESMNITPGAADPSAVQAEATETGDQAQWAPTWMFGRRLNVAVAREMLDCEEVPYPEIARRLILMLKNEFGYEKETAAALTLCHDILNASQCRTRAARFLRFVAEVGAMLAKEKLHPTQMARMHELVAVAKGRAKAGAPGEEPTPSAV